MQTPPSAQPTGLLWLAPRLGVTLLFVGFLALATQISLAYGAFESLMKSVEWPMGNCSGILDMPNGWHVVPHMPTGRVQVYDADWHFQRGWHIQAHGGFFKLASEGDSTFVVGTYREPRLFHYSIEGALLRTEVYRRSYDRTGAPSTPPEWVRGSSAVWVPTWPWLIIFSGIFPAFFTCALGLFLLSWSDPMGLRSRGRRGQMV